MIKSNYRKEYAPGDLIKIVNSTQAAFYWLNGLAPLDSYPSRDFKTKKPVMVFVFRRNETKELFDLWCKQQEEFEINKQNKDENTEEHSNASFVLDKNTENVLVK